MTIEQKDFEGNVLRVPPGDSVDGILPGIRLSGLYPIEIGFKTRVTCAEDDQSGSVGWKAIWNNESPKLGEGDYVVTGSTFNLTRGKEPETLTLNGVTVATYRFIDNIEP